MTSLMKSRRLSYGIRVISINREDWLSLVHLKIQNQKYILLKIKILHMENILLHELSIHLLAFIRLNYFIDVFQRAFTIIMIKI